MLIKPGFGIIEIIVALGLFAVVGVTGITMVLHSFTTNRLGGEQTTASNLSSAGNEVIRGLRDQNWSNLVAGTYGLKNTGGVWSLSPSPETWDKFTRSVTITDGQRDISGNIVEAGGTLDPDLKKITTTTSWNVGGQRNNSVVLTDYLTNFSKTITSVGDAIIVWGDTTTSPKWSTYTNTNNIFGATSPTTVGESARNVVTKTSPIKQEAIVGYTSATGTLHVLCFNGTTWTEDWSVSVGGTGATRRFDIGYEEGTGDVMVAYSTNSATNNEIAYRTKPGSTSCGTGSWSTGINLSADRTNGIVQWIKLAEDERSGQNILAMAWEDATSALSTIIWNGSAWGNEPTTALDTSLERATTAGDTDAFDLTYESTSGNLMTVWGRNTTSNNANGVFYRRCTGGSANCTWGATSAAIFIGSADDATNLDISSNPTSNEIVFASIGNQQNDLQAAYWNGTLWTTSTNRDTSCATPTAGSQKIATGWLISGGTTRSLITYDDIGSAALNWVIGILGIFTTQTDVSISPATGNVQGSRIISLDPKNRGQILFSIVDTANDLFVRRAVMDNTGTFAWTNTTGAAPLELNLSQNIAYPFDLAFWRHP